jgi:DNA invertase Pin-like site-specific DNA recombinase
LIVSEQSRLSRDTADTVQLLKELAPASVRVFAYQDDRAISLETPSDTLVTTINAWKDAEGRREASVRTHEALSRKARAAHVTGGRVFGYRNVDVFAGVDTHSRPQRLHVTGEIRADEAAVVQRIFELCAAGYGVKRIAARLNEASAPCPRAAAAARRLGSLECPNGAVPHALSWRRHLEPHEKAQRLRSDPSTTAGSAGVAGQCPRMAHHLR